MKGNINPVICFSLCARKNIGNSDRNLYVADVIVYAPYRGKGYGGIGLDLLCSVAKQNGVKILYDDIAIDNLAITMFLKRGFIEEYRTSEIIMLKKEL